MRFYHTLFLVTLVTCHLLSKPADAQEASAMDECLGNALHKPRYGLPEDFDMELHKASRQETTEDGRQECAEACCDRIDSRCHFYRLCLVFFCVCVSGSIDKKSSKLI